MVNLNRKETLALAGKYCTSLSGELGNGLRSRHRGGEILYKGCAGQISGCLCHSLLVGWPLGGILSPRGARRAVPTTFLMTSPSSSLRNRESSLSSLVAEVPPPSFPIRHAAVSIPAAGLHPISSTLLSSSPGSLLSQLLLQPSPPPSTLSGPSKPRFPQTSISFSQIQTFCPTFPVSLLPGARCAGTVTLLQLRRTRPRRKRGGGLFIPFGEEEEAHRPLLVPRQGAE